jgi:hypothetical protein
MKRLKQGISSQSGEPTTTKSVFDIVDEQARLAARAAMPDDDDDDDLLYTFKPTGGGDGILLPNNQSSSSSNSNNTTTNLTLKQRIKRPIPSGVYNEQGRLITNTGQSSSTSSTADNHVQIITAPPRNAKPTKSSSVLNPTSRFQRAAAYANITLHANNTRDEKNLLKQRRRDSLKSNHTNDGGSSMDHVLRGVKNALDDQHLENNKESEPQIAIARYHSTRKLAIPVGQLNRREKAANLNQSKGAQSFVHRDGVYSTAGYLHLTPHGVLPYATNPDHIIFYMTVLECPSEGLIFQLGTYKHQVFKYDMVCVPPGASFRVINISTTQHASLAYHGHHVRYNDEQQIQGIVGQQQQDDDEDEYVQEQQQQYNYDDEQQQQQDEELLQTTIHS